MSWEAQSGDLNNFHSARGSFRQHRHKAFRIHKDAFFGDARGQGSYCEIKVWIKTIQLDLRLNTAPYG